MTGSRIHLAPLALAAAFVLAGSLHAAGPRDSLKKGSPKLQSISALAFGPEGILFIGDARAAAIVALDTQDYPETASTDLPKVESLDEKIASLLGIEASQLVFNALAVNPRSGNTYLGVTRGKGAGSTPVLLRVNRAGKLSEVALKDVPFAHTALPNPGKGRQPGDVITHMAYLKGKLYVACLSNEEFASRFRVLSFPFKDADKGTGVEIFHGSHNRVETKSPIRTFVPYQVKGEENILAAYTCTPLVQIPVASLKAGEKVRGKTIAELGNHNRPLDMIVYQKDGKDYILMANSSRGVMKIPTEGIDKAEAITKGVKETAGLKYETIKSLAGTEHLDAFDKDHALVLIRTPDKKLNLQTIEMP
ncbi:MAG TPA: hypothetical protein VMG10_03335 [Gemmataceae bacterium]|nr:hypothetical protein [Gemmataceae bacterium]